MSTPAIETNVPPQGPEVVMPTLLGVGYHNYDAQPNNFIFSFLASLGPVAPTSDAPLVRG